MERSTNARNRILQASALAVIAGSVVSFLPASDRAYATPGVQYSNDDLPATMTLTAVIRDFKAKGQQGGHPDFQAYSGSTTVGLVEEQLGRDGVPTVKDLRGMKIGTEFRDSAGRNINPAMYDASKGDQMGSLSNGSTGNGLTSAEDFDQWYKDVPGVNLSTTIPLTLVRVPGTARYVFDSSQHEPYKSNDGFFPIDDSMYGNYSNGHNFHFTTEVRTEFIYRAGSGQVFKFTGDDDVWVFIGGKLVIDLGGLHSKKEQYLDLDRLDWLENGKSYTLDIFHAERRTTQSNFRIETTLQLRDAELPTTSALSD